MSIQPLPVILEEEEERKAIERLKPPSSIVCRYSYMKLLGEFPYEGDEIPGCGTKLVIRTERGTELAEMLTTTCTNSGCGSSVSRQQMLEYIEQSGGKQFPFTTEGKVIRLATPEDTREQTRIDAEKPRYIEACRRLIRELKLDMKLVEVELLLGGERAIFYFTSEDRVDFRELVRLLAAEFHTRIEMQHVGARDEARLVADYEKCGQQCCCKQFLKVLKPVSMKSAKVQKATLDPTKISGRCGRLMCCLRYEDVTYEDLRKRLPNRNSTVMTEDGPGRVVNTQILTQLVLVELDAGGQQQAYPVENIEQLTRDQVRELKQQREAETKAEADGSTRAPRTDPNRSSSRGKRPEAAPTETEASSAASESSDQAPRRPKPGRPLTEAEVESREGERAAEVETGSSWTPDTADDGADGTTSRNDTDGSSTPTGDKKPRGGKRKGRRRRRSGGKSSDAADANNTPTPQDEAREASGTEGEATGGGKKRSRRRRGRKRGKRGGSGDKKPGDGEDGDGS